MRCLKIAVGSWGAALLVWLGASVRAVPAEPTPPESVSEYHLKCVFLYNFGRFVEWPKEALGSKKEPFVIGVLREGGMEDGVALIRKQRVKGRPVKVVSCESVEEMRNCHIIFLNSEDDLWVKNALLSLRGSAVLTVGEREGFCRWGGAINFRIEDRNLRLDINPRAAGQAGLKISAQLLELARIVEREAE